MNPGDTRFDGGWFVIWRSLLDKPVYTQAKHEWRSLLMVLISEANWKPSKCPVTGRGLVEVDVGQLVRSGDQLCRAAGSRGRPLSRQTFRSAMAHFRKCEFLTYETTKTQHLITITNYRTYQQAFFRSNQAANPEPTNSQPRANQQPTTYEQVTREIRNQGTTPTPPTPSPKERPSGVRVFDPKPFWELARTHCPPENRDVAMAWWMGHVHTEDRAQTIVARLEDWDKFRAEYPIQLGMDGAFLWWCQYVRTPEAAAEILEGLARWKASDHWSRGVSIFNADTFLAKKKFKADPPPMKKPVGSGRVAQIEQARQLRSRYASHPAP